MPVSRAPISPSGTSMERLKELWSFIQTLFSERKNLKAQIDPEVEEAFDDEEDDIADALEVGTNSITGDSRFDSILATTPNRNR